ncbi:MAG: hypothetical protein GY705_11720 [Bacteroidetes bacterium]|nr:hypothetical protein [Bacteroidota bacterium]
MTEDETIVTVNSEEELVEIVEGCRPEGGHHGGHGGQGHHDKKCFEPVFPLTVALPDGATAEATDKESLREIMRNWKENNPDSEERPTFVFPIEVEMTEDETIVTVNSEEELVEIIEGCSP